MTNTNLPTCQILLPVAFLSIAVFLFLGFQTIMLASDHSTLTQTIAQQQPTIEQADKVKDQLNALAVGTLKFAQQGDKDSTAIVAQLKKVGYTIADPSQTAPAHSPAALGATQKK